MKKYTDNYQFKSTYLMESFHDFFDILKDISLNEKNKILWYRGQLDESWNLKPNLFRHAKETADYMGRDVDPLNPKIHFSNGYKVEFPDFVAELDVFKKMVLKEFPLSMYIPNNDFEWLFLGQHYGLLTPLVDFTTDPLIALYFSTDGNLEEREFQNMQECEKQFFEEGYSFDCASVFVMLPGEVNKLSSFKERNNEVCRDIETPVIIEDYRKGVFDGYTTWVDVSFDPLCIIAPKKDYRIIRQSGNFLCYGGNIQPIDYNNWYKNALYKIYIPYCIFSELKYMLTILDLTSQSVYGNGTYTSIATSCKDESQNDFYTKIKEFSNEIRNRINVNSINN